MIEKIFIDFDQKFTEKIFCNFYNEENILFVFNNDIERKEAFKEYSKYFLFEKNELITMNELKERIFFVDKILLREEKRVLAFYEMLSDNDKKKIGINDYYDSIETANNFFNFYHDLTEGNVEEITDLNNWQNEMYNFFEKMKKKYYNFIEEKNYTDILFMYNLKNFSKDYLNDFKKIVFVNHLSFTKLENNILNRINDLDKQIFLYNNIKKTCYDEKQLKILEVDYSFKKTKKEIEIIEVTDSFLQTINFLDKVKDFEGEEILILDPAIEKYLYPNLLSFNKFNIQTAFKLSDSKIFKFLNQLYEILCSIEYIEETFTIKASVVIKALYNKNFRRFFKITNNKMKKILKYANYGYKYFSKEIEEIHPIISEIEKLQKFKSISDYIYYLENLDANCFREDNFKNVFEMYYSALSETLSIEKLEIVSNWKKYFGNKISEGIFRLVLKYLRLKKINRNFETSGNVKINSLDRFLISGNKGLSIILNISEGIYPSKNKNDFLLTENQKKKLGIKTYEEKRLEEEYIFSKIIGTSKKTIIFTIKNRDKNIEISSFIENLLLNKKLEVKKSEIKESSYKDLLKHIFETKNDLRKSKERYLDKFIFDNNLIEEEKIVLGFYDYKTLKNCPYKFFIKNLFKIEPEYVEIKYRLDLNILGNLVHEIFDKVAIDMKENIFNNNFEVQKKYVKEVLDDKVKGLKLKFPNNYKSYYHFIVFPSIVEGVVDFYNKISEKIGNDKILNFYIEKDVKEMLICDDKINAYIKGRADLIIETQKDKLIIDYKTGKSEDEQLDFYEVLYYENSGVSEKYFYNIFDKSLNKTKKIMLNKEILKEDFLKLTRNSIDWENMCGKCECAEISRIND